MSISAVILAAGKGTRMKSALPKVLHPLAGKPLLGHVYDTAGMLQAEQVVIVYGHGGETLLESCKHFDALWIEQKEQLGTGHAVIQTLQHLKDENRVLVLYGDVPLITPETLNRLLEVDEERIGLLTVVLDNPTGYGRILKEGDEVTGIVEEKDASDEQRLISEVNTGILCCKASVLKNLLAKIDNDNSQGEYYLTDIFALARKESIGIDVVQAADSHEVEGVNTRRQLAELERAYQIREANRLMDAGVTLMDPARIDIRGKAEVENDVTIDVNVVMEGEISIGKGSVIGPNCHLVNCKIGRNVEIKSNCVLEDCFIDDGCVVGPFARLRPEAHLAENARVGNFVEIKKSNIGKGSKVNHLSYIGDTDMGSNVNIGAGTITCNYDGANKHKTIIGNDVFVGSDTQLVAPVTVGDGATVGAGTTITKNVDNDVLTISRVPQKTIKDWTRPVKKK